MNAHESWCTRWVATPYQGMLRTLGQAPDLAPGEPSAELTAMVGVCPLYAIVGITTTGADAPATRR
jgi:hypothetical protein